MLVLAVQLSSAAALVESSAPWRHLVTRVVSGSKESVHYISDINVVARLLTVTIDRRGFAASNLAAEDGDYTRAAPRRFIVPRMLMVASATGLATEWRTLIWAARW
jgi:hypothetical protein